MHREVSALKLFGTISQRHAPKVLAFDAAQCVVVMEDLRGFALLRDELLTGNIDATVAGDLGAFLASVRRATETTKVDVGGDNNAAMRGITRDFVFTKPFTEDPTNRVFDDSSDAVLFGAVASRAAAWRGDAGLLTAIAKARADFDTAECLCHGDLHAGSVMTNGTRTAVIDAEFAYHGPSAFDFALLVAGYAFAYCASTAWAVGADEAGTRRRKAKLAIRNLLAHAQEKDTPRIAAFAACELSRRVLGAASVPDLTGIKDAKQRADAELLVLDVAASWLRREPPTPSDVVAALDDAFDAMAFATTTRPASSSA
mmetsp:Transcript_6670/g.27975  ORF Transcript_6670/g.27975 Transcript_6670/m.27975 type:complete len:314 (-) Transcript_6670:2601-3542(-)